MCVSPIVYYIFFEFSWLWHDGDSLCYGDFSKIVCHFVLFFSWLMWVWYFPPFNFNGRGRASLIFIRFITFLYLRSRWWGGVLCIWLSSQKIFLGCRRFSSNNVDIFFIWRWRYFHWCPWRVGSLLNQDSLRVKINLHCLSFGRTLHV